jgi:hypothetical protein
MSTSKPWFEVQFWYSGHERWSTDEKYRTEATARRAREKLKQGMRDDGLPARTRIIRCEVLQ